MSYLFPPRGRPQRMTAAEFAALPEDTSERVELVRGRVVVSPRPLRTHMFVIKKLLIQLEPQLPPSLVSLPEIDVDLELADSVRVPDVVLVAADTLDRDGITTAADVALVIEVLSPGNRRTDLIDKLIEYADARIPHYWIVDPEPPVTATVHRLVNGHYEESVRADGRFTVDAPCPLTIDLDALLP